MIISTIFTIAVILFLLDYIVGLGNILRNLKKRGIKDLNKDTVKIVGDYAKIKVNGLTLQKDELARYSEQLMFRRLTCPQCWEQGACVMCGCDARGLMITPTSTCKDKKDPKWYEMDLSEQYEKDKERIFLGKEFKLQDRND